ncbi:bis-aminopropyl spermidine synthase family protein [Streptosporangium carneum]|uniref:Methyltransferase n=1 Tax=Streptosporangium carneum TaxID=47481 RepID=A0A9W6I2N6_9ACTN|nr:bis-aminopropyl spermidine synthase family protein [Streptosporangium carneum]GLK10922.1 methyltransferase [Streptosporangium carneum]
MEAIAELLARAGVDGRRPRAVLAALGEGRWWTLADLVRETATARRTVEALLRETDLERSGDRFRLRAPLPGLTGATGREGAPADPVAHLLADHAPLVARMDELIVRAPRGRHTLDHVSATAETVVRRALLLEARFWLDGARLLCVGDHDLTSLAAAALHPGLEVTVVDVDERILGYIAERADLLGLPVRTRWADLRLGLPASARSWADLAITDPPYTPEGVGLFVARAAEGLRDREQGRILLAYGASERTPALALKVQQALSQLNLLSEAIYPDFNRYLGAEAIGSAADLYVLRPTTKTWPALSRQAARADGLNAAIYTQGPQAVESAASAEPVTAPGGSPEVLVGDWPKEVLPRTPRARLSTWLAKPYASDPGEVAIAVPAGLEAALPRLLLATRARRVQVTLAAPPASLPAEPLSSVYELTAEGRTVHAVRLPLPETDEARILRRILDNAHGKVANTWREALIGVRGDLTKKQARAVVSAVAPWADDVTVLELPAGRLGQLGEAVARSLSAPVAAG